MENLLNCKNIVVTGATSGIGFQSALDLAGQGARVIGIGRSDIRCEEAQNRIIKIYPNASIEYLVADLSSQKQVRLLAEMITRRLHSEGEAPLDVLVNNAGLYMGKKVLTEDGIETTFAVNHLAPFLLTILMVPLLKKSMDGRVITVSSDSHYHTSLNPEKASNPSFYFGLTAYKVSKLCNILFTAEFNRVFEGKSPHAFAVDPGLVNTDIGVKGTGGLVSLVWRNRQKLGVSPTVPSQTIQYLASEPGVQNSTEVYWHLCKPKNPDQKALDPALALKLWDTSCALCGIREKIEE